MGMTAVHPLLMTHGVSWRTTAKGIQMRAELSTDMLPILMEQQTYFMARVLEEKQAPVMELYRDGLKGWDRLANSPRCVTVTGRYDVMITPRHASCSCKAFKWSRTETQTCKHLQAVLLLLFDSGFRFQ